MNRRKNLKFLGITIPFSLMAISSFLSSCGSSTSPFHSGSKLFSTDQWNLLNRIVDLIIPETSTPSASAVGVPVRIEMLLFNNYSAHMRGDFLKGLSWIAEQCEKKLNKSHNVCSSAELSQVLDIMIANTQTGSDLDTHPFYPLFKGLTVSAFFTSKEMHEYFKETEKSLFL